MSFKEKLQMLAESQKSVKLDKVKRLLERAASHGEKYIIIGEDMYDSSIVHWLRSESLEINENLNGVPTLRISW